MNRLVFFVIALVLCERAHSQNVLPQPRCIRSHETYNSCGSACPLTCENYMNRIMCTMQCVQGCFCENGYVRNEAGDCVLTKDCQTNKCVQENEMFTTCGTACPLTCNNYMNAPQICTAQCVIGCKCMEGYVRNEANGSCVLPSECP